MAHICLSVLMVLTVIFQLSTVGGQLAPQQREAPTTRDSAWLTGRQLERALQHRVSISWSQAPLRQSLRHFSDKQRVAVFLDRRVDPGRLLELDLNEETVLEVLYRIADATGCAVCQLDSVFYIGPREEVAGLIAYRRQMRERLRDLDADQRRSLLAKQSMAWPTLTRPQQLLEQLQQDVSFVANKITLPHDLWPAYDLPPLSLLDRGLLVPFGFGYSIRLAAVADSVTEGGQAPVLEVTPFNAPATTALSMNKRLKKSQFDQLRQLFPDVSFENTAGLRAEGITPLQAYSVQRTVARWRSRSSGTDETGRRVVSLKTVSSLGSVLNKVADQLDLQLQYDAECVPILRNRITVDVTQVSYAELIETALAGTELEYELTETHLIVRLRERR